MSVDGTENTQCNPKGGADAEVALDIQMAGAAYAVATGKAANIRVYWSQDITKAIMAATSDGCDICSISWGADEVSWGVVAANALEQAAIAATTAGMVVFAASGDNDSGDGGPTPANVDLPAAAPHVIGCGGTKRPKDLERSRDCLERQSRQDERRGYGRRVFNLLSDADVAGERASWSW